LREEPVIDGHRYTADLAIHVHIIVTRQVAVNDPALVRVFERFCDLLRECCPFLAFGLVAQPNKGEVIVRVTGPIGAKEFLRTILCRPGECM